MKHKFLINRFAIAFTVLLLAVVFSSCNNDKHNGKYVKDKDGKVYLLEHRIGRCYFINDVNTTEIDSVRLK
jgi:hypothetical protein